MLRSVLEMLDGLEAVMDDLQLASEIISNERTF